MRRLRTWSHTLAARILWAVLGIITVSVFIGSVLFATVASPLLIGQRVEEPVVALDGSVHRGIDAGSLGRSANARAPMLDAAGPVGEVSVALLQTEAASRLRQTVLTIIAYAALALGLGLAGSLLLARTIKRITFGLEPAGIVGLVQEREATLHGIREGVVALDRHGRVSLAKDEARRLTGAPRLATGQSLDLALPTRSPARRHRRPDHGCRARSSTGRGRRPGT